MLNNLDASYGKIFKVLGHWGCSDPELKLTPPRIFPVLDQILRRKTFTPDNITMISMYADGIHDLIVFDGLQHPDLSLESRLSEDMLQLLQLSLNISRNSLHAHSFVRHPDTPVSHPYENKFETEFEEFMRTGAYSPDHPIIRTFKYFRQDYLAEKSRLRYKSSSDEARAKALELLKEQSDRQGQTCNKYKTKHSFLTPGIFTVFCAHCGICEGEAEGKHSYYRNTYLGI